MQLLTVNKQKNWVKIAPNFFLFSVKESKELNKENKTMYSKLSKYIVTKFF